VVRRAEQLHGLFHQVTSEARAAFGNGDLYIEKFVTSLRHIEAQILRDTHGNTRVIGLRDCSVQRNNQKLMEESGSTMLPAHLKKLVLEYANKIANAVNYTGAGTVEFIYDVPSDAVYFMEMNTRLQVEHPVTEMVTGVDIVKTQFKIASGESIEDLQFPENGYALEVRVNAEKAVLDAEGNVSFAPTPGEITLCELPQEPHIQLISMAGTGKIVSPFYDSLIIQIICHGKDRNDTVKKMLAYLQRVKIHGISTNISLVKRILVDKVFLDGVYDTTYLPDFLQRTDMKALIAEVEEASGTLGLGIDLEMLKIEGSDELKVLSPSTGIFYRTPSPTEPDFVSLGDVITAEHTLCQLEAMKMFTPVNLNSFAGDKGEVYASQAKYEITRINIATGQQVNEGDLLFVIKPLVDDQQVA
jgi:acetyl/propionyl-CoA carboxylase alpha subunit